MTIKCDDCVHPEKISACILGYEIGLDGQPGCKDDDFESIESGDNDSEDNEE